MQFFALRVTPPARQLPVGALKKNSQKWPTLQSIWEPSRDENIAKWSPKTSKIEVQTLQNRAILESVRWGTPPVSSQKGGPATEPEKKRKALHNLPPFYAKAGSQNEAKIPKTPMLKTDIFRDAFLMDFGSHSGSQNPS